MKLPWIPGLLLTALATCPVGVRAQEPPKTLIPAVEVHAVRTTHPPNIDGHLNEEAWVGAPPVSGFVQRDPNEGKPLDLDELGDIRVGRPSRKPRTKPPALM